MLQIKHIRKEYRTKSLTQTALDDVSISFRDSEFVAILGPSGSGKTTLLNVIGGLDRYDSGDLIINGLSTRHYRDSDWDYYRAHTIGFVFQSYNLIPHQSVLANVELALTIAGISRRERRERAVQALEKVGLGDQIYKKPNQMSGGQMQRVAIARALVNDPDIVLADEPTGALDSRTSIQVMELLKEVAKDRLVIMVTHNPDLAARYATRTVRIKDGKIIDDTNPLTLKEEGEAVVRKAGHSSMSFLTALSLSFNNLRTKKARTLLVSIAGSIGIIGIALVMALSNGATVYINDMERQAMGSYPLQISSVGYDLSSMMSSAQQNQTQNKEKKKKADKDTIGVSDTLTSAMSTMSENDLSSLKKYIDSGKSDIRDYTADIEYLYDAMPQIYLEQDNTPYLVSPSKTGASTTLFTTSTNSSDFYQLPQNASLYENDYQLKAGHWPAKADEAILVISSDSTVTDTLLYEIGIKPYHDYEELNKAMQEGRTYTIDDKTSSCHTSDFLGRSFKVLSASDYYVYDDTYKVYASRQDNEDYIQSLLKDAQELKIVGIVQPKEDVEAGTLSTGIGYTYDLTESVMEKAASSAVVKAQQADPDTNVLTGKAFTDTDSSLDLSSLISVDQNALASAFALPSGAIDTSALSSLSNNLDLSSLIDPSALSAAAPALTSADLQNLLQNAASSVHSDALSDLFKKILEGWQNSSQQTLSAYQQGLSDYLSSDEARKILSDHLKDIFKNGSDSILTSDNLEKVVLQLMDGFEDYQKQHSEEDISTLLNGYLQSETGQADLEAACSSLSGSLSDLDLSSDDLNSLLSDLENGYQTYAASHGTPTDEDLRASFETYLTSDETSALISSSLPAVIDTNALSASVSSVLQNTVSSYTSAFSTQLSAVMTSLINQYADALTRTMANAMSQVSGIDGEQLAKAFSINMDEDDLQNLLTSMMSGRTADYASNLRAFGYADEDNPSEIDLYPKDFDSRSNIRSILDSYNKSVQDKGQKDKTIVYTDLVATMLSSVTDIIHTISYILIAFVGISLVVSSIMIGVITYISVLERRKEIGILRALGASRHNIAQVFNAETFITGLLSGLIGVVFAILLCIPLSSVIHHMAQTDSINMSLPLESALGLILLSIVLTVIAGIIPSHKAAKSDPVAALRTE